MLKYKISIINKKMLEKITKIFANMSNRFHICTIVIIRNKITIINLIFQDKMQRKKARFDLSAKTRRYNIYRGILEVASKKEVDIQSVRATFCQEVGIADPYLSMIERSGIDNDRGISLTTKEKAEAFFSKYLGYEWKLEVRPQTTIDSQLALSVA
jgi:uncharacterized protein (UPF0371 family)